MKKKLISLLLCVCMTVSLATCGQKAEDKPAEAPAASEAEGEEPAEQPAEAATADLSNANVAVFYYNFSDTYTSSVRSALDKELTDLGVKFQNYDANNNQATQNEQIDTALSTGANVLIVNIVTSGSVDVSQAIVDKAAAKNVPIIFFNKAIEGDGEEGQVLGTYDKLAFVGTDAPEAGHMQGKMIGEYLMEHYEDIDLNGDGTISYALFMGELGNVEAIYRSQYGVEDADAILKDAGKPALEYFDSSNEDKFQVDQDGAWSATAANNYMTTNLSQYNETNGSMIELVICNNDAMAEGAISALNDKGYNTGAEDSTLIPVFGVDATDAAKQLIQEGKMVGTVKQDAEGMAAGIAFLVGNAASGKEILDGTDSYNKAENVPNKIYIPYAPYTGE